MVVTNRPFSKPRRVWNAELISAPPRALPFAAPDCWSRIAAMTMTESIICAYGSTVETVLMRERISRGRFLGNFYKELLWGK